MYNIRLLYDEEMYTFLRSECGSAVKAKLILQSMMGRARQRISGRGNACQKHHLDTGWLTLCNHNDSIQGYLTSAKINDCYYVIVFPIIALKPNESDTSYRVKYLDNILWNTPKKQLYTYGEDK